MDPLGILKSGSTLVASMRGCPNVRGLILMSAGVSVGVDVSVGVGVGVSVGVDVGVGCWVRGEKYIM